jgi:adenosylcobinamide-GDP ribazoletransferase
VILAFALFTVLPVRVGATLTRAQAVRALRWFPVVGAALGAAAALPIAAARAWSPHASVLAAVVAVAVLALLTRGLHLDGLADTADGLGSRAPADRALEIMRRSDIGPFGVLAIVFVVLLDVAALAVLGGGAGRAVAALSVAAATGRVASMHAAHRRVPSARAEGFGAFVAGSVPTWLGAIATVSVLGYGAGLALAVDADVAAWLSAQAAALAVIAGLIRHVGRRLGGVTGDVFGAVVELGTALVLTGLAFS